MIRAYFSVSLLAVGLFFWQSTVAQTTYEMSDFIDAGDEELFSRAGIIFDFYGFAATGEDHTWNFEELPVDNQFTDSYLNASSSIYKWPWCLSEGYLFTCEWEWADLTNMRKVNPDTIDFGIITMYNQNQHFKKADNLFQETLFGITADIGGVGVPVQFEFSNSDTIYQFPLNYGDVDSSNSELILDFTPLGVPFTQKYYKKRVNTVDGWGELTTPYGYFPEVLRMKTVIEARDTTIIDSLAIPITTTTFEYKWFSPLYTNPVLTAKGNVLFGAEIINEIIYIDSLQCIEPNAFFVYDPIVPIIDSAAGFAAVNFYNFSSNTDSVYWSFGDGESSTSFNPEHGFYCPGLHNVELIAVNTCDLSLSDTFALPILVTDTAEAPVPDTTLISLCEHDSLLIEDEYIYTGGIYESTLTSFHGCDSTVIWEVDLIEMDTTLSLDWITFSANQDDAVYQWINCDDGSVISGENDQEFTPSEDGTYAVILEREGCIDTSACKTLVFAGVKTVSPNDFKIYPNPFDEVVQIEYNGNQSIYAVQLFDFAGREINAELTANNQVVFAADLIPGAYILEVILADDSKHYIRLFKK